MASLDLLACLQGGCIIRAGFLNDIKAAYKRNIDLKNLVVDPFFADMLVEREQSWRKVVSLAIQNGVAVPGMTASLAYFDTYRRARLPANLVQVWSSPLCTAWSIARPFIVIIAADCCLTVSHIADTLIQTGYAVMRE